ncbi:sodium:proton antiporter NhaD [Roseibium aggregatum]|uniref:Sodium:proton antiporter NhaD n=1 Tax=Roseibium aggregatum TaxID=187304 RepID=A0A926NRM6_9HYPH|nr:sodium:proton antiporter NhaD [Roseibium aggregatum]MBD1545209.1 sodium:proton antiporter NhaD [Roseibium aggregatum]
MRFLLALAVLLNSSLMAMAAEGGNGGGMTVVDLTNYPLSWMVIVALVVAYGFVVWGEQHHLEKSIPVLIGAGVIWAIVGIVTHLQPDHVIVEQAEFGFEHSIIEIGELTFFLVTAMTYVVTLQERNVFEMVRYKLLGAGLSQRAIFWATGLAAFLLSPLLDNLTTALALISVVIAVGAATRDRMFVSLAAINLVVAANAGGAFSPFGDITTLMVWQAGKVEFFEFFSIFVPSLVNWLVPAVIMSFAIKSSDVEAYNEPVVLKRGARRMIALFALTLVMAVSAHIFLELPPVIGMTTGLGFLMLYGYFLSHHEHEHFEAPVLPDGIQDDMLAVLETHYKLKHKPFNPMTSIKRLEWDTLLFFFGILMAVAGVSQLGFLLKVSEYMYGNLGPTFTNSFVGVLSAVVDNIPVMSAVLKMDPNMVHGQWMLVTLTAGVGGSLLSVGSAAGVALMGAAKMENEEGRYVSVYTFMGHLKWTWAVALGYAASIWVHTLLHQMY